MKSYELKPTRHPDLFRVVDREGNWEYYFHAPSGKYLRAVSSVLHNGYAKPRLAEWLKNNSKEDIENKLSVATEKGTKVHHAIEEAFVGAAVNPVAEFSREMLVMNPKTGKSERLDNDEWDCLLSFYQFWTRHEPVVIGYEESVYSLKAGFAGTIDLIGILTKYCGVKYCPCEKFIGKVGVLDYKTGGIWDSYGPQLSAYGNSDNLKEILAKFGYKNPEYTAIIQLGCEMKSTGGVRFEPYDRKESGQHWKEFMAAMTICDGTVKPFDPEKQIVEIPDQFKVAIKFAGEKIKESYGKRKK